MFTLEQYAYSNNLRQIHPLEKATFTLVTLIIVQLANSMVVSLGAMALMTGLTVLKAGIPGRLWLKMLGIPGVFLGMGAMVLMVSVQLGGTVQFGTWAWQLGPWSLQILLDQWPKALLLLMKGLASVSCLYFLTFTTPMVELLALLRTVKLPALFVELTELVYRFIFVLLDTAVAIFTAQEARLGYSGLAVSFRSLGTLISMLFLKSYHRATQMQWALEVRGYEGQMRVLRQEYHFSQGNWVRITVVQVLLITMAVYVGGR